MIHNAQTIQTIEALTKLARGTLNAEGIAELRRQLAPHECEPLYWSDSRTVKARDRAAFNLLATEAYEVGLAYEVSYSHADIGQCEIRCTDDDIRQFVAIVNRINKEF